MGAGSIIKDYIGDRDIRQKDLALQLRLSPRTLGNYLAENRAMPEDVLIQIARLLDLSTDYIHGLTQDPHPVIGMSEEDYLLLTGFRALEEKQRALVLQIIRFLREQTRP